jgi:NAD(P)-dependent dehydrogenase (short-subunit alcohol dehydrogenase family)
MRVNVTHTLRLIQRILPAMADGGAIVNLTSSASGRPARWGGYGVSKAALEAVTLALRAELAPRSIRCVSVNPGPARTAMRAAAYPEEDPATVPHPSSLVGPVLAIVAGADPGPRIEAREWRG